MNAHRRLLLALALVPIAGRANDAPRLKRLGVVYMPSKEVVDSFPYDPSPLASLGWVEGRTLEKVRRYAGFDMARLEPLAREVIAERPDVLLTSGVPMTRIMHELTKTIPICAIVDDPVGNGFAKTMARPGGNITGLCEGYEEASEKEIELLRAAIPSLKRIAIVSTSYDEPNLRTNSQWLIKAAAKANVTADVHFVEKRAQLEAIFGPLRPGASAVYLRWVGGDDADRISKLAISKRVAVVGQEEELVDHGALMTFRMIVAEEHQLVAMLDRLLRGGNPATIPFELPSRSFFAINRATATAIGVKFPGDFLLRADKVVD